MSKPGQHPEYFTFRCTEKAQNTLSMEDFTVGDFPVQWEDDSPFFLGELPPYHFLFQKAFNRIFNA